MIKTKIEGIDVKPNINVTVLAAAVALASVVFMPDAKACSSPALGSGSRAAVFGRALEQALAPTASSERPASQPTIVGMWIVDLNVQPTGVLIDRVIEQFHTDGNEMMSSSGVPPATGNVCFGVWQATGPRSLRLRHTSWGFDTNGTFNSVSRLWANITVDPGGDTYTGDFVADALDLSGAVIPGSTIRGTLKGTRFKPI